MAYTFVQSNENSNQASGTTITIALTPAAGNLLVFWTTSDDAGAVSMALSDGGVGNTFAQIGSVLDDATNGQQLAMFYAANCKGGATTFTCTFGASIDFRGIVVAEYSGLDTASPLINSASANVSGTTAVSSGNINVTSQPAAIIALTNCVHTLGGGSPAAGSGFTGRGFVWAALNTPFNAAMFEDERVIAIGNVPATFIGGSTSQSWQVFAAAFKEASTGTSVNLTGQTSTSSEGTVSRAVTYSLTGQTATFTEGTISASVGGNVTLSLSGQTITSSEGTISPNIGYLLDDGIGMGGQTATFAEGTPTQSISYALTGQSVTSTEGTASRDISYTLGAQTVTLTEGNISVSSGGNVTITLSGQTATFTEGVISPAASYSILGQSISLSEGSIARLVSYGVTGLSITATEGTITQSHTGNVTYQLVGFTITSTEGVITFSGGIPAKNIMPTLTGLNLWEAQQVLQQLGILVPATLGYFGTWPISAVWIHSAQPPNIVVGQSIAAGTSVPANSPITLTVSEPATGVVFP